MAGAACKVVINQIIRAIVAAVERILLDPDVHTGRLTDAERALYIQRLADLDLATYTGAPMPRGGVAGILVELEKHGIVTDEVWQILRRPELLAAD